MKMYLPFSKEMCVFLFLTNSTDKQNSFWASFEDNVVLALISVTKVMYAAFAWHIYIKFFKLLLQSSNLCLGHFQKAKFYKGMIFISDHLGTSKCDYEKLIIPKLVIVNSKEYFERMTRSVKFCRYLGLVILYMNHFWQTLKQNTILVVLILI